MRREAGTSTNTRCPTSMSYRSSSRRRPTAKSTSCEWGGNRAACLQLSQGGAQAWHVAVHSGCSRGLLPSQGQHGSGTGEHGMNLSVLELLPNGVLHTPGCRAPPFILTSVRAAAHCMRPILALPNTSASRLRRSPFAHKALATACRPASPGSNRSGVPPPSTATRFEQGQPGSPRRRQSAGSSAPRARRLPCRAPWRGRRVGPPQNWCTPRGLREGEGRAAQAG